MKKALLLLLSFLLISNICFANYEYKTFRNSLANMDAPSHWVQYNPGIVGNSRVLIDLKSPDGKASALVKREEALYPYNNFNEMSERALNLLLLNEYSIMQQKYPSAELLDYKFYNEWDNNKHVFYIMEVTFPTGKYRYFVDMFINHRHLTTIVVMTHLFLLNNLDIPRMIDSVGIKPPYIP